ncbi:MAG TPA: metallophosphoesterase [Pseudonocardiaceae bacterium]|nr:metallophosphoesterase [Pseudonocardiaceae bacterium]
MKIVPPGSLLATSDLHVTHKGNREIVEELRPAHPDDWLIVAGDVAESLAAITWCLGLLRERFAKVIWVPGNHELWTVHEDAARGQARYEQLVELARGLDVVTPEDEYPVFRHEGREVVVAPLFLLYDYSFREPGQSLEAALEHAYSTGLVFNDEHVLHADPYPSRQDWCAARVELTEKRLAAIPEHRSTVLVSHFPLHRGPTRMLRHPHLAMWCGTERTADWHLRFRVEAAVYGHLHIPLTLEFDGIRFEEVSLGYPREWRSRAHPPRPLRPILPADPNRIPYNAPGQPGAARFGAGA